MSVQAITWALKARTGSPSGKAVLLAIANYADAYGRCWPSQALIAQETEQSVDSVQRRLKELEARGLLVRQHRAWDNGGRTSDLCILQIGDSENASSEGDIEAVKPSAAGCGTPAANCGASHRTVAASPTALLRHEPLLEPSEDSPSLRSGESGATRTAPPPTTSSSKPKAKRGTRLSPDWNPSDDDYADAEAEGFTRVQADRIASKFRDFWIAKSGSGAIKLDWSATWRNWVRKEADNNTQGANHAGYHRPQRRSALEGADALRDAIDRGFDLPPRPI